MPSAAPRTPRPSLLRVPTRSVLLPVPAARAFAQLTDVTRHAHWVPLTRIDVQGPTDPDGALLPGGEFTAVTGPTARRGGPGLVDRMRLDVCTAPDTGAGRAGTARYVKLGPVLTGWAEVDVRPLAADLCEVTWTERIGVRGLPAALTDAAGWLPTTAMLALVLHRAGRELRRRGR